MEGQVILYAGLLIFGLVWTFDEIFSANEGIRDINSANPIDQHFDRAFKLSVGFGAIIFGGGLLAHHFGVLS